MNWTIRPDESDSVFGNLSTAQVQEGLSTGRLSPFDWARRGSEENWEQLVTIDEFAAACPSIRRRGRQAGDDEEGFDMTPMIDVTFLLLTFFMITASFQMQKGLDFPPDRTEDQESDAQDAPGLTELQRERIILNISQSDTFQLRAAADGSLESEIDPDRLADELRSESEREKKFMLLIMAHELASHEAMVRAIDSAALAGITQVSIADIKTAVEP